MFWYIRLIVVGRIQTVVASWIVSTTALFLSLVTYASSAKANLLGGALNASSVLSAAIVLLALIIRSRREGTRITFIPFQKNCLIASGVITFLWIAITLCFGGEGIIGAIPNFLTQILLVISYSMLIKKFWRAEKNTESLIMWWCILIASVIALYTAVQKEKDWLAFIYATRSTVLCAILLVVLHRADRRSLRSGTLACA